ncbi:MAG: hypothetical protein IJS02_04525 [Bacteroidales bacterium]|nr:hypothetical protein [Bacteroidales bacterium]
MSDIKIDNIENVSYSGETILGDVTVSCNIINPNRSEIQIVSGEAVVYRKGRRFAYASSYTPVTVPTLYQGRIQATVTTYVENPLTLLTLGFPNLSTLNTGDFTVDYDINIKSGNFTRKLSDRQVPLSSFIKYVDLF